VHHFDCVALFKLHSSIVMLGPHPTNYYSHLTYGALGLATEERQDENGSVECRGICENKSSEYMS
jgi:hypothetical protein